MNKLTEYRADRRRFYQAFFKGFLLFVCPSFQNSASARFENRRSASPEWVRALPVGKWSEISGTALGSSPALYSWPNGRIPGRQSSLVTAWGGWAVDLATNRLWLQGGGHGDYGGNEIYGMDLRDDAPVWSLVVKPTPIEHLTRLIDGKTHSKWNKDGTPVAAHIYWSAHFIGGMIYRTHYYADFGAIEAGRHPFAPNNEAWLPAFDTINQRWNAPDSHALVPNYISTNLSSGGVSYAPCCSDGTYYYAVLLDRSVGMYRLCRYDPESNVWQGIGNSSVPPVRAGGTFPGSIYDSLREELVQIGEKGDTFVQRYSLGTGERVITPRTGVEFGLTWDSSYSGVCYDSKRDKYYLYSGKMTTDKNLYVIDPASRYHVSIMTDVGTPTATIKAAGLNSRFKYFEDYDVLVMQPMHDENLLALRFS